MTKYEEIMDQVVVTDGMRDRILRNIRQQQSHTHTMRPATTWLPILAAAAVMLVVCGTAYQNYGGRHLSTARSEDLAVMTESAEGADEMTADTTAAGEESSMSSADSDDAVAAIWEAQEYASAEELQDAMGYPVPTLTTLPFEVAETRYMEIVGIADITYKGANENEEVTVRKSVGTEDNSGDYTNYSVVEDAAIGDHPLSIYGDAQRYYLATWNDGTYAYSIRVLEGCDRETMQTMIEELQ